MGFIMLRYVPSILAFWRVFIINGCWILSKAFSASIAWTVAHQAPLSMNFFRPKYWSGFPFPSLRDLPDPGIKPASLTSSTSAGSLPMRHLGSPKQATGCHLPKMKIKIEKINLTHRKNTAKGLGVRLLWIRLINFSGAPEYTIKCPGRPGVYSNSCPLSQ